MRPHPSLALVLIALWGCGEPTDPSPTPLDDLSLSSSTIALAPDGDSLWLTSPDDDTVVKIDTESLEVLQSVALEGQPSHLAPLPDGGLVVTLSQSAEIGFLEAGSRRFERIPTPCGGSRGVVAAVRNGRRMALVVCPHDARVAVIDLDLKKVSGSVQTPPRPSAIAVSGELVTVSISHRGELVTMGLTEVLSAGEGAAISSVTSQIERPDGHAVTRFDALAVDGATGEVSGAFQLVDHDSDRDRPPEQGGYGSVIDDAPRIEPRLMVRCGGQYARFTGGNRVFSGPVAMASGGGMLWVVHQFTQNVAVLRCGEGSGAVLEHVATFEVGPGARGIALAEGGLAAFVDVGFDHAVARIELADGPSPPVIAPERVHRRTPGPMSLSVDALRGRRIFHDATNTHLTPSGVVTCATCHPDGGDDGLVWFIHTAGVSRKFRRTAPSWNARIGAEPFHWDGQFPDGASVAFDTITELMEGDALVIDTRAIAAYMNEVPAPLPRPLAPAEAALAVHGESLFNGSEVGCSGCHAGALRTDGLAHSVAPPSEDPDGRMEAVITRPLIGVRTRAPFLHDGRAAALRDVFTTHNPSDIHGRTSHLSEDDLRALSLYLETF